MARSKKKEEQIAQAVAEVAIVPLWQLRCVQSAMRKFEATGSGVHLFPACRLVAPDARWDTPTMASKLNAMLVENADRLAVRQ